MKQMKTIPVYLITGFLDSGKTTLLTDTLNMDYFNDGQRTVLLRCEDGEEEFDQEHLSKRNCRVLPVESADELTYDFLMEIDRRYQPERVLFEYNGMWPLVPRQYAVHDHRHGVRRRHGAVQPRQARDASGRLEALRPGRQPHVRDRL